MSFVDVKLLNSNFKKEPLNYLSYINSIEQNGENSYLFDPHAEEELDDLIINSSLVWAHKNLHHIFIEKLTHDELKVLFTKNKNIGNVLNALFGEGLFSSGSFNNICEYMTSTALAELPDNFFKVFVELIEEIITSDNALTWINDRYGLDLSGYGTLEASVENTEAWKKMIEKSSFMCCVCPTTWFTEKVIKSSFKRIWISSDGKTYYDDAGIQYNIDTNEKTGSSIALETLEVMKTTGLVTEGSLEVKDSVYSRLQDALTWLLQNGSLPIITKVPDLVDIMLSTEGACQYFSDNPTTALKSALRNYEFTKKLFQSEMLFEKIGNNSEAMKVIVDFISDIQLSYDTLKEIKSNLSVVSTNTAKIYDAEPLSTDITPILDNIDDVMSKIIDCQDYTSITQENIDAIMANSASIINAFNNSLFVKYASESPYFSKAIIKNTDVAGYLSENNTTYPIALSGEAFMNALNNDSSLYESYWISNNTKKNFVTESQASMKVIGVNEDLTRRYMNHKLNYVDSEHSSFSENMKNSSYVTEVTADELIMKFMGQNKLCADTMVDSELIMNAIYANAYGSSIDTETVYNALKDHGDIGFYKWFIQKAASSSINYTKYASWTAYVAQMTNGTILPAGFKEAIDNAPDLVNHVLGESSFLMEILFDPSKIRSYSASGQSLLDVMVYIDPSNFLSLFNSLKNVFKENPIFIGNMLYYMTRLLLGIGGTIIYYPSDSQKTIHKNFSEWTTDDVKAFHSWRTLYYYHVNGNCVNLKDWLYNSNIFMTKYILYILHVGGDINEFSSLEEICANSDKFSELIHSDKCSNMAFYSPELMKIIGKSKDNLVAMYNNHLQVETNMQLTSNQDQLPNNTSIINTMKESPFFVHKEWHISDDDPSLNFFTSTDYVLIEDKRCLVLDIQIESGTGYYSHALDSDAEKSFTGTSKNILILKFVSTLSLKVASGGKIKYIEYLVID